MLKQTQNNIYIEGILSEIDLKEDSYEKEVPGQGKVTKEYLAGKIIVRVAQEDGTDAEIPVHVFATKIDSKGKKNKAYESIEKLLHMTSIASGGEELADRVKISGATLKENAFHTPDGVLVSQPRIEASFINRINKNDCHPKAIFDNMVIIGGISDIEKNDVPTGEKLIRALLVQYGGKVDIVNFVVKKPDAVAYIENNWSKGDAVIIKGVINFTTTTQNVAVEVEFGEAPDISRTTSVRELVITAGSASPVDNIYEVEELNAGIAERNSRLEADKQSKSATPANKQKVNLGF